MPWPCCACRAHFSAAQGALRRCPAKMEELDSVKSSPEATGRQDDRKQLGLARGVPKSEYKRLGRVALPTRSWKTVGEFRSAAPLCSLIPKSKSVVANQTDAKDVLKEEDGVFIGLLPAEQSIANTAVEWSGVRWNSCSSS
jgi:hypothetical protein